MKLSRKKSPHYIRTILIVIAILVFAAALAWYLLRQKNSSTSTLGPVNTVNYDAPTKSQSDVVTDTPTPTNENQAPTSQTAENTGTIDVSISSANSSSGELRIRTIIRPVTTGSCALTLTKSGSQTITKQADLQTMSTYSTCQGFDIPLGTLSPGSWTASVSAKTSSGATGSAYREVTVE